VTIHVACAKLSNGEVIEEHLGKEENSQYTQRPITKASSVAGDLTRSPGEPTEDVQDAETNCLELPRMKAS
jgi:hypothetical protein